MTATQAELIRFTQAALPRRTQFTSEPAYSVGFHRIIQRNGDLFDPIAIGAVERAKFKSCRPRRDARKLHARSAFWTAELLNGEQWDCGWVICHCHSTLLQAGAQHSHR